MTISVRLNDLGLTAARGRVSIQGDMMRMSMAEDASETMTIRLTDWLGASSVSATSAETHGLDVVDSGVASNVWTLRLSGVGYANLKATASDGRVWWGRVENVDPQRAPYADRYRYL